MALVMLLNIVYNHVIMLWFSKSLIHTVEVDVLTCPVALRLRGLVGGVVDDVHDLEVVPESSTNPATVKRI